MRAVIGSNISITDPSFAIKQYCNERLSLPNPEYIKRMRMGYWTGNTPRTLFLYRISGNVWTLPFGTLREIYPMIRDCEVENAFAPAGSVEYGGEDVPLYDYQQEAVDMLHRKRYGILQSAAGSGKTQMGIALVKLYARPALWLTHTADLLEQSKERAERYMDRSLIGTITAGKVHIGKGITFATVQTMSKLDLPQYRDMWDVIIVDECHHVAGSPTAVTQFYRVLDNLSARHKYGLSATVHRSDGLIAATYAMLGEIVHTVPDSAVKEKIMQVTVEPVGTGTVLTEQMLNSDGTLNFTGLINGLCAEESRNRLLSQWIASAEGHSCLILSDRIEHLQTLMNALPPAMRAQAALITGKMNTKRGKAERVQVLDRMRNGDFRYLFATYSLAKEGLDIPCLDRLFLTTPVKDEAVVIQSIGRIARTCPGKQPPVAYDFVDNILYCKRAFKQRCRHYNKIGAQVK